MLLSCELIEQVIGLAIKVIGSPIRACRKPYTRAAGVMSWHRLESPLSGKSECQPFTKASKPMKASAPIFPSIAKWLLQSKQLPNWCRRTTRRC